MVNELCLHVELVKQKPGTMGKTESHAVVTLALELVRPTIQLGIVGEIQEIPYFSFKAFG